MFRQSAAVLSKRLRDARTDGGIPGKGIQLVGGNAKLFEVSETVSILLFQAEVRIYPRETATYEIHSFGF